MKFKVVFIEKLTASLCTLCLCVSLLFKSLEEIKIEIKCRLHCFDIYSGDDCKTRIGFRFHMLHNNVIIFSNLTPLVNGTCHLLNTGSFKITLTVLLMKITMYRMYCMYCTVQDLPESLSKLKKLQRLDLGDNEIDFLPPHIGDLESLEGQFTHQFTQFLRILTSWNTYLELNIPI